MMICVLSTLHEVTAGAARLVDSESTQEIASGILELVENDGMRRGLADAGRRRSAEFSWHRTARLTLEVYQEAIKNRESR